MSRVNLHLFFSPIVNESRLLREAKALRELAIFEKVIVVGVWESGLSLNECAGGFLDVIRAQTATNIRRAKGRADGPRWMNKLLAARSLFDFARAALCEAMRLKPTHVSCHNLFLLPVAWIVSWIYRSRVIYVPHELEVERTGLSGTVKWISTVIERSIIRRCGSVVVVSDPIAVWYRERYGLSNVHVIRNIPDFRRSKKAYKNKISRRAAFGLPQSGRVFIYQGILNSQRGIDALLQIFEARSSSDDNLMLMGYGDAVPRVKDFASRSKTIHYMPAVPVQEIVEHSELADIGVFCLDDPLALSYQYSLPNKFFEYLLAGLPVIVSPNLLLLSHIVEENGLGWTVPVADLPKLLDSLTDSEISKRRDCVERFLITTSWETERLEYRRVYQ